MPCPDRWEPGSRASPATLNEATAPASPRPARQGEPPAMTRTATQPAAVAAPASGTYRIDATRSLITFHDQAPVRREAMVTARRSALVGTAMTSGILARPSRQTFGGGGTYESRSRPARLGPFVGPGSNGSPCRAAAPLPCNGCMQNLARAAPSGRGHGFQAAPAQAAGRTGPFWQFASDATTAPVQRAGAGGPMTNSSRSCAVHEQAKHHLVRAARGRPSVWKER